MSLAVLQHLAINTIGDYLFLINITLLLLLLLLPPTTAAAAATTTTPI